MKKLGKMRLLAVLFCMVCVLALSGCNSNQSGNTIDEPEITPEYLMDEYAQQLMTDGAETISGAVSIENADGAYTVHIVEKEVVPNSSYDEGYYIADTNVTKDVSLGDEARIVCSHNDGWLVSNAEDFIENHSDDSDTLYTVYLMGDSAELILVREPEDLLPDED